jgi:UDP-glucose:(heptosyl)LPS alpha-1,3-glucosyltransferase
MIAHLSFPACHRRGGVERIMAECAAFLAGRGHDVSVLSAAFDDGVLPPAVRPLQIPAPHRHPILRNRAYRRAATEKLAALRAAAGGPSVHASFGVVCPPDGVLWVQAVHAEWLKIARERRNWKGRLKQRLNPFHPFILRLERNYYRGKQYRRLIALTDRVKNELVEHYDVPPADIDLLPNGYNPAEFNPARRAAERPRVRAELGYADADRVLVFVANELERKGFFPLLDAMAKLKDPSLRLLVAGRVSLAPHQDLLARLGLAQQVKCVGPSADVGRYYAAADLFVLPTYYEAWGLVIVEAMAMGLPVLTSRLAGAAVAVHEPRAGLLLDDPRDPAEIAKKLDQLLRATVTPPEEISRSVDAYRWDRVLLTYESILQGQCR